MGSSTATSDVYIRVIEDVIHKVRDDFVNNGGPGHTVLLQLQGLWEAKMTQVGAILGPIERTRQTLGGAVITPVHDLNVPYEGTEEYETPTTDILFPQTPMPTPLQVSGQTPLPGTASELYNIPTGDTPFTPGEYPFENGRVSEMKPGRPSQFMQPPALWLNQRPSLNVNVGCEEVHREASHEPMTQDFFRMSSGKRKRDTCSQYDNGYIPQQDGSGDAISDESKIYNYQGVVNRDYNIMNTPSPERQAAATFTQNDVDDELLNENDDDDLDDVDQGEEHNIEHLVLAQFDKVSHIKNRWKCTLRDAIMHINNKDILFNKANGEFDFSLF